MKHVEHAREWIKQLADSGMYQNPEDVEDFAERATDKGIENFIKDNWQGGLADFERSIVA